MRVTHGYLATRFLGLAAILTMGCDDPPTGPPDPAVPTTGAIRITATTIGVDRAPDGYNVEVRFQADVIGTGVHVPISGTATVSPLPPGIYLLTIVGLVPNCEPVIPSPLAVAVDAGSTTPVALDVTCVAPTQLAFVNGAGSDAEIYVVNSDGTGASRITTQPGADVNPAWSPDGSRIAFASQRDGGNVEIYVMSANGTNPERLTNVAAADYRPAWSPDGARIAFVSERDGNAEIYVMNADGTSPMRLTSHNASDSDPTWSPDGSRIAFVSDRDGNREVYVMNANSSGLSRLTSHNANDGDPAWSPDGSGIAFISDRDGNAEVYVMTANGAGPSRLTFNNPRDAQPVWSPDGTRIAFANETSSGSSEIYVMNANGSGFTRLTQNLGGSDPAWSPDGRKIAFTTTYCGWYSYGDCDTLIQVVRMDGTPYSLATGDRPSEPAWRP